MWGRLALPGQTRQGDADERVEGLVQLAQLADLCGRCGQAERKCRCMC